MATSRGFIFNLLTPKSEEEIKKEEQRDTSSLYSAVLPIVGAIIWVLISLANLLILTNYIASWKLKIESQNDDVTSYEDSKKTNGELFLKTRALSGVIEKNIDPAEFFELVEGTLFSVSNNIQINAYGREDSGIFNVDATTTNFEDVAKVVYAFTSDAAFKNVKLNNVINDVENDEIDFKLSFEFVGKDGN